MTGLATAYMDSVPVVAITGQVPTTAIGTDSFQESDVIGSTMSVVKHSYLIKRAEDIAPTIKEAFHVARTGRPGPVLIDFPKDLQAAVTAFNYPEGPIRRRSYPATPQPDPTKLRRIAQLIEGAKRPVILAGRGVLIAGDMCSDIEIPLLDTLATDPLGDYRTGMERLASVPGVRQLVPGHGHIGDAAELRRRLALDAAYLDTITSGKPAGDPRLTKDSPEWMLVMHDEQVRYFER